MKFKMIHENYNVADLNRSLEFYERLLASRKSDAKQHRTVRSSSYTSVMKPVNLNWN